MIKVFVGDNGDINVEEVEVPENCNWMKKVLQDRQHSRRTTYNVLESEKQQHKGDDNNES